MDSKYYGAYAFRNSNGKENEGMNLLYQDLGDRFTLSAPNNTFRRLFPEWNFDQRDNGGPATYDDLVQSQNVNWVTRPTVDTTINKYSLYVAAAVNMGLLRIVSHESMDLRTNRD